MAYLRQYQMRGDPFLGGLFSKAKALIGGLTGLSRPHIQFPTLPGAGKAAADLAKAAGKHKMALGLGAGAAGLGFAAGHMTRAQAEAAGLPYHKRRRMHVTNTKALRRAMRRVTGFAREARKVMTFTTHHRIKKARRR